MLRTVGLKLLWSALMVGIAVSLTAESALAKPPLGKTWPRSQRVSMDKIEFKAPVYVGDLVSFYTETIRVGRTSMTVHVTVWSQRRFGGGEHAYVTEAEVTMVAVDDDFKPTPIAKETAK